MINAEHIDQEFNKLAAQLERYVMQEFPVMAVRKTLRFIHGNFRAQGWQGRLFMPWKKNQRDGTILVNKGKLRRSFHGETSPGVARVYCSSPYGRYHNRGFKGTVQVSAHTRSFYTESKKGTGRFTKAGIERTRTTHTLTGTQQVKAHQRQMNLDKRQFMPESINDSPVLMESIKQSAIRSIKQIFK